MFGNFIYFIVVLLIYTTHQPPEKAAFSLPATLALFCALVAVFFLLTRLQFQKLEQRIASESFARLDHQFTTLMTRQSIMAIILFAIDIYVLNLSSFTAHVPLFLAVPTVAASVFLMIFVAYLAIVWACAHETYRRLYNPAVSRQSYIASNISFSIPVLLPWLVLSGVADLIDLLPFTWLKQVLATTSGQALYFLFFLLAVAILGPAMIQKFWGCTPLESGAVRQRIENLCRQTGIGYSNILYWPIFGGKMITAGVLGLVKRFRYILVTRALLRVLEPEEIDAVIAHEIGHVKKKHLLFYLVFFVGFMVIPFAAINLLVFAVIYAEPVYRFMRDFGIDQVSSTASLSSLIIIVSFIVYFRFIFGYFMRNFERQADTYVYAVAENAKPLISTLEKIALTSGQPPDKPNWHHFSIAERVAYLQKCENDRSWIRRHDRKIRNGISVYLIAILLLGWLGYSLNFGSIGQTLNDRFSEKIIQRLEKSPRTPGLYRALGDIYLGKKNYAAAIRSYEGALALQPQDAEVLNNLAWLYATCEDPAYRDPRKALGLAQRAADLKPVAHILDTLAESYFVNGEYAEAVRAARLALKITRTNEAYFEDQLKKFLEAERKTRSGSL